MSTLVNSSNKFKRKGVKFNIEKAEYKKGDETQKNEFYFTRQMRK